MNSTKEKISNFLNKQGHVPSTTPGVDENEEIMLPKDGLYERREVINKKLITKDGKQLLREQLHQG